MKKFLLVLTLCFSVFSVTAFASNLTDVSCPYSETIGKRWIAYEITSDTDEKYPLVIVYFDKDDVPTITLKDDKFSFGYNNYSNYCYNPSTGTWVASECSSLDIKDNLSYNIYYSGFSSSDLQNVSSSNVTLKQESVCGLNFQRPPLVASQKVTLATMTKDFSVNCSVILKVVLVGLALLLGVSLIVRVIRSYL